MAEAVIAAALCCVGLLGTAALGILGWPAAARRAFEWLCWLEALNAVAAAAACSAPASAAPTRQRAGRPPPAGGLSPLRGSRRRGARGGRLRGQRRLLQPLRRPVRRRPRRRRPAAVLLRSPLRLAAVAAIAQDRRCIDAAWGRLCAGPAARATLARLDPACCDMEAGYGGPRPLLRWRGS